jgi:hypothetical protein
MGIRGAGDVLVIGLVVGLLSAGARADANKELDELAGMLDAHAGGYLTQPRPPRFAFTEFGVDIAPKTVAEVHIKVSTGMSPEYAWGGLAADKKSAWIAAELKELPLACGMVGCDSLRDPDPPRVHATALAEKVGEDWQITASHVSLIVTGKQQKKALQQDVTPSELERSIAGAEDVVKQLQSTLGDPKRLAASVSARKDVVLFGSEPDEHTTGGEAVRAQLLAWKLAFKVRDGIVAGKTASKALAYVAANVDATSLARPKDKPMPYRMFAIYEKTGAAWQIVLMHFSVVIQP